MSDQKPLQQPQQLQEEEPKHSWDDPAAGDIDACECEGLAVLFPGRLAAQQGTTLLQQVQGAMRLLEDPDPTCLGVQELQDTCLDHAVLHILPPVLDADKTLSRDLVLLTSKFVRIARFSSIHLVDRLLERLSMMQQQQQQRRNSCRVAWIQMEVLVALAKRIQNSGQRHVLPQTKRCKTLDNNDNHCRPRCCSSVGGGNISTTCSHDSSIPLSTSLPAPDLLSQHTSVLLPRCFAYVAPTGALTGHSGSGGTFFESFSWSLARFLKWALRQEAAKGTSDHLLQTMAEHDLWARAQAITARTVTTAACGAAACKWLSCWSEVLHTLQVAKALEQQSHRAAKRLATEATTCPSAAHSAVTSAVGEVLATALFQATPAPSRASAGSSSPSTWVRLWNRVPVSERADQQAKYRRKALLLWTAYTDVALSPPALCEAKSSATPSGDDAPCSVVGEVGGRCVAGHLQGPTQALFALIEAEASRRARAPGGGNECDSGGGRGGSDEPFKALDETREAGVAEGKQRQAQQQKNADSLTSDDATSRDHQLQLDQYVLMELLGDDDDDLILFCKRSLALYQRLQYGQPAMTSTASTVTQRIRQLLHPCRIFHALLRFAGALPQAAATGTLGGLAGARDVPQSSAPPPNPDAALEHCNVSLLIEWLVSAETEFREYLLHLLVWLCRSSAPHPTANPSTSTATQHQHQATAGQGHPPPALSALRAPLLALQEALTTMQTELPFNPGPLIRRLQVTIASINRALARHLPQPQ